MSVPLWEGVFIGGILAGTPVLYATLGEVIVQRGGMVNLGLEGQATTLETAGALVFYSSFQAARFCAELAVGLAQRGA